MSTSKKINQYKFEDSVQRLSVITFSHIFFFIIFLISSYGKFLNSPRAIICLIIFLCFFITTYSYDWLSPLINYIFLAFYAVMLLIEITRYGIPASLIDFNDQYQLGKGVMFDIFIALVPYVYISLRFIFVYPIINVILRSQKLKKGDDEIHSTNILDADL